MDEEKAYKNYIHHPIWKMRKTLDGYDYMSSSVTKLFNMKGYTVAHEDFNDRYSTDKTLIQKTKTAKRTVINFLLNELDILVVPAKVIDGLDIVSKITRDYGANFRFSNIKCYDEDGEEMYKSLYRVYDKYVFSYDELADVKYLYVALPNKMKPYGFKKILSLINANGIASPELYKDKSLQVVVDQMRSLTEQYETNHSLTTDKLTQFLTYFEEDTRNERSIPPEAKMFFLYKPPQNWKMEIAPSYLDLIYDGVLECRNAYISDKLTPLKLPMWIEQIRVRCYFSGGGIGVDAKGFHNDLGSGYNMCRDFESLCVGNVPINDIKTFASNEDWSKLTEVLNRLTRAMTTTNLDHPMWQYGGMIWGKMQVIGEDKK